MSDIQYSTESLRGTSFVCYGCRHHMGCNRVHQGFLGCRCRIHGNPIALTSGHVHMKDRICASFTWHYGDVHCPDWEPPKPRRQRMDHSLRYDVADLHGANCYFCGKPVVVDDWTGITALHHIKRRADGGSDEPENLRLAHTECHDAHHRAEGRDADEGDS